jgi:hypothetical protein
MAWCLLLFHSPGGGSGLWIDSAAITVIKKAPQADHVATGAKTILFTGIKAFAVIEEDQAVAAAIKACGR